MRDSKVAVCVRERNWMYRLLAPRDSCAVGHKFSQIRVDSTIECLEFRVAFASCPIGRENTRSGVAECRNIVSSRPPSDANTRDDCRTVRSGLIKRRTFDRNTEDIRLHLPPEITPGTTTRRDNQARCDTEVAQHVESFIEREYDTFHDRADKMRVSMSRRQAEKHTACVRIEVRRSLARELR